MSKRIHDGTVATADLRASAAAKAESFLGSWCPQCGPDVGVDEDGCCATCGATAVGDGADTALKLRALVEQLKREYFIMDRDHRAKLADRERRIRAARVEIEISRRQMRELDERLEQKYGLSGVTEVRALVNDEERSHVRILDLLNLRKRAPK